MSEISFNPKSLLHAFECFEGLSAMMSGEAMTLRKNWSLWMNRLSDQSLCDVHKICGNMYFNAKLKIHNDIRSFDLRSVDRGDALEYVQQYCSKYAIELEGTVCLFTLE